MAVFKGGNCKNDFQLTYVTFLVHTQKEGGKMGTV